MGKKVLITGGTGSLGKCLSRVLMESDYEIRYLSRKPKQGQDIKSFKWDYKTGEIELDAFNDLDYIIHLAGAPVVKEKWTRARKAEIRDSRIKTAELLFETVVKNNIQINAYISASALGYYGYDSGGVLKNEESTFGDDFLATVVKEWEQSSSRFASENIRQVSLRIGLILSDTGGALPSIVKPIKMGVGAPIGSGEQYMSWIHEYDMAQIIKFALENEQIHGVYNSVAPNPVTNRDFTKEVAKILKKPVWLPAVPGFFLKWILGERASMILGGNKVSCDKIVNAGFNFKYTNIEEALQDLL